MRVLFTSTSGWGHIHPMVPLAQAFLARQDEVVWATGAEGCARLHEEGIQTVVAGLDDKDAMASFYAQFPEIQTLPPPERSDFVFPRLFGRVRTTPMLADLMPVVEATSPDLIVCDAAEFAGPIAAARVDVPNITHSFGALLPAPRVAAAGVEVGPLWTSHGLEPRPYGGAYDHLYLDIYPTSLQPGERAHVPDTQALRPGAFATGVDEHVPEWVMDPSSPPLVYVTFGTVFSNDAVLSTVVEAIRELPVGVIVTVGPKGDPLSLGTQPDNVHVARYIPQRQLLEHCAAVVSHAGSGTFLAALAAQLPLLCIPQGADQFFNAAACAKAGVGIAIQPGEATVEHVADSVRRLLTDATFGAAATRISAEIAAMPSPEEVVTLMHERHG